MTVADRIKQKRIELGYTQLEIAKKIGLETKAAICKIEKQGDDVSLRNVEKLARALNCSPTYLLGWDSEDLPQNIDLYEHSLLRDYNCLTDINKENVIKYVEFLVHQQRINERN